MKIKKTLVVFFLIAGFIISGFGILDINTALQCKQWSVVKGRIMGSTVGELETPGAGNPEAYIPDIAYEYKYKGQTYFSQSIVYLPDSITALHSTYYAGSENEILDFIKKYPINSEVDVFVNPDNPECAVLDTTLKMPLFITLLFGGLLIYLALHISLFGDRYVLSKPEVKKKN